MVTETAEAAVRKLVISLGGLMEDDGVHKAIVDDGDEDVPVVDLD